MKNSNIFWANLHTEDKSKRMDFFFTRGKMLPNILNDWPSEDAKASEENLYSRRGLNGVENACTEFLKCL